MIEIEIKSKTEKDEYGKERTTEYLVLNGIEDQDSYCSKYQTYKPYAHIYNEEIISIINNHTFNQVAEKLSHFKFHLSFEWWENRIDIEINCSEYWSRKYPSIKIDLQLQEWEHWNKPWSMSSLAKEFEINVNKLENPKLKYWQDDPESMLNGFGVEYYPSNPDSIISEEIDFIINMLQQLSETTNKNLINSMDGDAIFTYFQFPENIKSACKQYLIYFVQFLADLGIFVDTELKEELNYTLFKISPKDKNESLEKIQEVLNVYLNVPQDNSVKVLFIEENDIAVKQWEANIYHLKSQLLLAQSVVQAKDAAIESLQLSNFQYKQLLESYKKKEDAEEEVIKGVVSVNKYKGKGFSINLAEIIRRLKRKIKG